MFCFDVHRQQDLVRLLNSEKPEVLKSGLEEFPEPDFFGEWQNLRDELIENWGDVLGVTKGRRREQSARLRVALREMIDWGLITNPFLSTTPPPHKHAYANDCSSSDEEPADAEPTEPLLPDTGGLADKPSIDPLATATTTTAMQKDGAESGQIRTPTHVSAMRQCPECGSDNAIGKKFACRHTYRDEEGRYITVIDDRIRAFVTLLHELRVSERVMVDVINGAAKTFGIELIQPVSRSWTQNVLKEMAVLAKAEMGLTLYLWAKEDPQSLSVVIDAASIREQKFEGICICKKVESLDVDATKKHRYLRLGLGLIELSRGSDVKKQVALVELLNDCIECFNAVYAEDYGEELTLFHICKGIGYACNDHAETVVGNKFLPYVREQLELELGSVEQVRACLAAFHRYSTSTLQYKQKRARQLTAIDRKQLIELIYHPDATKLRRAKAETNSFFCANHRNQLGMDAALSTLKQLETNEQYADALPEFEGGGGRGGGGSLASRHVYSTSKSIGRGKFHETYTHTELFSEIRKVTGAAKIHFERLLGARGNQAIYANALPMLQAMLDTGDWGLLDFLVKIEAKKGNTNRLERDIRAGTESDMLMAELRVLGILHYALFRPMQTYVQSQASALDAAEALDQYAAVVAELMVGPVHPRDLGWADVARTHLTNFAGISTSPVVVHTHTVERRHEAAAFLFDPRGLSDQQREAQDEMMRLALHYMGKGMKESLDRLTSKQYYKSGSILGLALDDPRRKDMAEAIGTSDPVERYFGLFSHLREANSNQTDINRNNQGAIIETKLGHKLLELTISNPVAAHRAIHLSRRFSAKHHAKLVRRKTLTLQDRKEELDEAKKNDQLRALRKDAEAQAMEALAAHYAQQDKGTAGMRTRRGAGGTADGLGWLAAEVAGIAAAGKKRERLHSYLKMFKSVHGAHETADLRFIFFSAGGNPGILTQVGVQISTEDLLRRAVKCGEYVRLYGSPRGWKSKC